MTALLSELQQMLVQSEPSSGSCCTQLCSAVLYVCRVLPLQGARFRPERELGDGEKDKRTCQNSPLTSFLLIGILGDSPPGRVSSKQGPSSHGCLSETKPKAPKGAAGACQEPHPERGCRDSEGEGARQEDTRGAAGLPLAPAEQTKRWL